MADGDLAINPGMVVIARESRGLSQSELAQRLSISPGALSKIESGARGVSEVTLRRLCDVLGYPDEFFKQTDPIYGFGTSELFHRKKHNVPEKLLDSIRANINIRRMHIARMLRGVEFGKINIRPMDLDEFDGNLRMIARAVRAMWHLPPGPIQNLTRIIEQAGGIIIPFDFGTRRIDAISQWPPGMPPLFFVSPDAPSDRLRFTLCHELAHLVVHQESPNPDMERQSDAFASEFLMPEADIRPYLDSVSLPRLAALKPFWKVSMAALLMRAVDLGMTTPRRVRTLWMEMGKRGYRLREPSELDIPAERPNTYQRLIEVYRNEMGYDAPDFAKLVNLFEDEVLHIYFAPTRHLRIVG